MTSVTGPLHNGPVHWRRPLVVDTALALALAALTWGTMGVDENCPIPQDA